MTDILPPALRRKLEMQAVKRILSAVEATGTDPTRELRAGLHRRMGLQSDSAVVWLLELSNDDLEDALEGEAGAAPNTMLRRDGTKIAVPEAVGRMLDELYEEGA